MRPLRLAVMASHAIPYQAPLFAELAKSPALELMVFFGSDYGVRPQPSEWGGDRFTWDGDITAGYPHQFLTNWARRPHPSSFAGKINPGLLSTVMKFRPDALLLSGYASIYHWQSLASATLLGTKTLYFADSSSMPPPGLKGLAKRMILANLYRHLDVILTVGERNRDHYRAYGVPDSKMAQFPFSVGNARFRAQAERFQPRREELRRLFGIPRDATCVVFVGRLAREKNIAELIHAMEPLDQTFLLIVGTGPEEAALKDLAQSVLPNRHRFAGFLNQTRLGEAYAAADTMALPSQFEPWGLVLNEAMNAGLPIVVSDRVGAGPDLAIPSSTGYVYELGDTAALRRSIDACHDMLRKDREAVRAAVLARIDMYSEQAQAAAILRALGASTK